MFDLPDSIQRMRIISADLAALAITGLTKAQTVDNAKAGNWDGWEDAVLHKEAILSAVKANVIEAHSITINRHYTDVIKHSDLLVTDKIIDADVFADGLWRWFNELSHDRGSLHSVEESDIQWGEFAQKDIALKIIAGLAHAFANKSGGKFLNGDKPNAKTIGEEVAKVINNLTGQLEPDDGREPDQRYRKLIGEALRKVSNTDT